MMLSINLLHIINQKSCLLLFPNKKMQCAGAASQYMGQFVQGRNFGCLMSFFLKKSLRVTKPDKIAPLFQLSFVYHMLCMPKTL